MNGSDERRPRKDSVGALRLLPAAHRRQHAHAKHQSDVDAWVIHICPSVRSFYARYARQLGISTDALLRLVLVGVMTVLDDEEF